MAPRCYVGDFISSKLRRLASTTPIPTVLFATYTYARLSAQAALAIESVNVNLEFNQAQLWPRMIFPNPTKSDHTITKFSGGITLILPHDRCTLGPKSFGKALPLKLDVTINNTVTCLAKRERSRPVRIHDHHARIRHALLLLHWASCGRTARFIKMRDSRCASTLGEA